MPCMDGRERELEEVNRMAHRIACYFCATLTAAQYPIPAWAREWWLDHQRADQRYGHERGFDVELAHIITKGRTF